MKKISFTKERLSIGIVILISAILNFGNLAIEGYGNEYYAAGVKSMLMNFSNFFFVSFDPAGFVSIDKPPLGFWIQTISAKIFGFSGWSILLPQALAGVISVALVYYIVKRSFGHMAGLISAICLTITPVFVATSRNNTIDNLLIVTLLVSCLFLSKAAEKGKFKYLLISLALVGIGFNIKMLQAYMIVPALYITYLISTAASLKKRIKHLVISTVVLVVISFSWAIAVDLVPTSNRPFVGSSTNNTVMELISGHNGLERLASSGGGMNGGGFQGKSSRDNPNNSRNSSKNGNFQGMGMTPPSGSGGNKNNAKQNGNVSNNSTNKTNRSQHSKNGSFPNGGGFGKTDWSQRSMDGKSPNGGGPGSSNGLSGNFGGQTQAGITRLFSKNILSDQIVWFLPLSLLGFIAAAIVQKLKAPFDNRQKLDLILWFTWLVPEFIYFSFTKGLFHQYYLSMLAAPIAALSGIGITAMWKLYKQGGIKAYILPIAFIVEGLMHLLMLSYFASSISSTIKYIIIAALVLCFASAVLLILYRTIKKENSGNGKNSSSFAKIFTATALIGILTTPAIGSAATLTHSVSGNMPAAGLELLTKSGSSNFKAMGSQSNNRDQKLIKFLDNHVTNEKYALVVSSSASAEGIIIESGKSVMALGGFSGSDKILTLAQFKEMVKKGEVRYVLTGSMGGRDSNEIMNWIKKNGKTVSESEWKENTTKNQSNDKHSGFGKMNTNETLYDLKGTAK